MQAKCLLIFIFINKDNYKRHVKVEIKLIFQTIFTTESKIFRPTEIRFVEQPLLGQCRFIVDSLRVSLC